jgi:predicted kinase
MAAPVLAGIPLVYEMLVGAGILAGGAVTANKMQKEIQKTIDTNPGVIDEALKNIFMGPARDLINPKMLEEIQNVKPTTTAKKKTMPTTEISPDDVMANTLFQEPTNNLFGMIDTPSGTVLAPDATDIEKQRKEAAPKPLVTPMPTGQQDQTLSTPTPGQIKTETETFPAQEPQQQNIGTPVPEVVDTSILTKDLTVENIQNKIKYKKSKQDKNITEAYLGDKKIAEIRKDMDSEKTGNQFDYTINWTNEKGEIDYDDYDIETGFNSAKYTTALGFVNNSKSQEKEYLNKFIKAVENKDYNTLNKIREEEGGYDFEDSEFRSKEFKDTIDKYRPDLTKLSTEAYIEQQEAISELNKPEQVDKAATDQEVKKEPFEFPSEEVRNQEINLSKNLFELSQNNPTLDMYEQYKNNPIIQNKIESSKKAYVDTSAKEGYGTADYWANRKFVDKTVGYKDFIKKVYGEGAPKKNKEMYIVMGPSSAGKSTSLVDRLVPETGSYLADSDEIKKLLPEFTDGYNAGGVHKESSDINQRIMKIALARGDNIVYPTTGREPAKLAKEIERAEKYGYTPKVYLVTADREVLLLRNLERMLSTNRVVDSDLLLNEQLIKDINKTYENLPEKYKAGKYDTSKDKR